MKAVITSFGLLVLPMVAPSQPIDKCGTVAILEGRFKSLRDFGDRRAQTQALLVSPSGKFRLNYDTAGPNAVPLEDLNGNGIPDYVERAAQFADESWQLQVSEQGFRDPVGSVPYDIFFEEMGFYGYTEAVGDGRTFIVLHRNFSRFPPNTDPEGSVLGALKVTIAHEFKHAVQYATNQWLGDAGRVAWVEMDATMMEEIQYPQVNDYWNYLRSNSIFTNPNGSTPGSYPHATWMLHYAKAFGMGFWRDVWETIGNTGSNMFPAISVNLTPRGESYTEAFTRNHMWHFASGAFSRDNFGFDDRQQYPTPFVVERLAYPDSLMPLSNVNRNAARYYRIERSPTTAGSIQVSLDHNQLRAGLGLLAYGTDGSLRTLIRTGDESGTILIQTDWLWEDIAFLGMVVANATEFATLSFSYRFERDQVPEQAELRPNVPNPFRSTTRIDFALPERQHVRLTVYDPIGREIAVLVDGERDSGRHSVRFNARNMASGVYVVRLQTSAGGTVRLISLVR
jgi:hypothetical protein